MTNNNDKSMAVLGAGAMGRGIAQVFAQAGFEVEMFDVAPAALESAQAGIGKFLDRSVEKGKMSADDAAAVVDPERAWMYSSQQSDVRGQRPGSRCPCVGEADRSIGQPVESWRGRAPVAVASQVIRAQGIDREQQHVRSWIGFAPPRWRFGLRTIG